MLFGVAERYVCRAQQRQGENKRGSVRPNSRKDSGMYVCVSVCACMGAPAHVFCVFFFFSKGNWEGTYNGKKRLVLFCE